MAVIEHNRGNVVLKRSGIGTATKWEFTIWGDTSDDTQAFTITKPVDIESLKAVIGQVEHAYKVLSGERDK